MSSVYCPKDTSYIGLFANPAACGVMSWCCLSRTRMVSEAGLTDEDLENLSEKADTSYHQDFWAPQRWADCNMPDTECCFPDKTLSLLEPCCDGVVSRWAMPGWGP